MKLVNTGLFIVATLAVATTLYATSAAAGKQLYSGANCVRWSGNHVIPNLDGSSILNNSSTQEMYVDCPILHQNFNSKSGNNLDDADIGVVDASYSQNARCQLHARHKVGSIFYGWSSAPRYTYGRGNHEQNLDFNSTPRHPGYWYYINCRIPRAEFGQRSGITYYSAQE